MRSCNVQSRIASGGSLQTCNPPLKAARWAMAPTGSGVKGRQERRCSAAAAGSPSYKDRVQNLFKQRSKAYDTNNTFHPPLCQHLVQLAEISPGDAVLDVATGTGFVAFGAAEVVGSSGRVVGIDITQNMIDKALAKLEAGVPGGEASQQVVEFVCGDVEAADFPEGAFTHVLASNAMAYMSDVGAAAKRFRKWLRLGGTFAFNNPLAPMIPLSAVLAKVARDHFDLDVPDAGTRLGSPQIIDDVLTAAGYTDIQVTKTHEEVLRPKVSPEEYADSVFCMMETFPTAPFANQLSSEQIAEMKALYMPSAVEMVCASLLRGFSVSAQL